MPYVFGEDRQADACWLSFLDPDFLPVSQQRELLRRGIGPHELLEHTTDANLRDLGCALHRHVAAGGNLTLKNGINADYPMQLLVLGMPGYPPLLALCDDAPPALFAVGKIEKLQQPALAVVGARKASALGLTLCQRFSAALAGAGLVIASGLALGVDGAAHQGALEVGGVTVAVLPTGIDTVYPRRHQKLAHAIAECGVVVSEFLPGTSPRRGNFHRRNRTLSGLALGTLVIEAGRPSGSLITANAAAEQGREVFALPWSLAHPGGVGCLHLLNQGANLACKPEDILHHLEPGINAQTSGALLSATTGGSTTAPPMMAGSLIATPSVLPDLPGSQQVLESIGDELLTADCIAQRAGLPLTGCLEVLATLELADLVERQQGLWARTVA